MNQTIRDEPTFIPHEENRNPRPRAPIPNYQKPVIHLRLIPPEIAIIADSILRFKIAVGTSIAGEIADVEFREGKCGETLQRSVAPPLEHRSALDTRR